MNQRNNRLTGPWQNCYIAEVKLFVGPGVDVCIIDLYAPSYHNTKVKPEKWLANPEKENEAWLQECHHVLPFGASTDDVLYRKAEKLLKHFAKITLSQAVVTLLYSCRIHQLLY